MEIRVDPYVMTLLQPNQSIVKLQEREGKNRAIDITLNSFSLSNLFAIVNETNTGRPIIHKVMINVLSILGSTIQKVVIDDLIDGKFHSSIYVKNGEQIYSFDTHVTDSIGLSIIQDCPLFVLEDVFEKVAEYKTKHQVEMSDEEAMAILKNLNPEKALN